MMRDQRGCGSPSFFASSPLPLSLILSLLLALLHDSAADRSNVLLGSHERLHRSLTISEDVQHRSNLVSGSSTEAAETAGRVLENSASLMTQTVDLRSRQHLAQKAKVMHQLGMMPGMGVGKELLKVMALCAVLGIAFKMLSSACASKRCDCRRFKPIGKFMLNSGYDEFERFDMVVSVHSVQDVPKDGFLGKKEYKVKVSFNWSNCETSGTKDMRWEQTKKVEVPQGASECRIALFSLGKIKDSKVAEVVLETKADMLDKDSFWGEKQKFKLESKGNSCGTLLMTFRRRGEDGEDGAGCMADLPIEGVDETSALAVELTEAMEELENTPGFVKPEGKFKGELKVALLAKALSGPLREINLKGKDVGVTYVKVVNCNFAELRGDDMADEMATQKEKAKKKGLPAPEKKWYWAWYEDKKTAEHPKRWHYPDGFFPIAGITSVHRSPERQDQFIVKYSAGEGKEAMVYRREAGKSLDAWVEGLDLCFTEVRKMLKESKDSKEKTSQGLARMRQMHQQWVQQKGMPQNEEQWTQWFTWFRENNFDDDLIRKLYQEIAANPSGNAKPKKKK
eukprot:TRINITY_DN109407_c0_g1_i1.p1 TRINITY_DN109407_c0_g1~~TRINITY_DN109407_c0_g1_i1.p1  ORF type:complete len:567 (+),score=124.83 TRINITY_DN109407_c0_g1_i1:86-1786(+)